jgi:hypothetical protein
MNDAHATSAPLRRSLQAVYSMILLAVLICTCVGVDLLARNRSLERWLTAQTSELARRNHKLFSDTGNFIDFEDRVLLDQIPRTDYSKGGIFFFGTSNMKWAFQTWDLPAAQRHLIGNYGIGASNHTTELELIRYLIAQRGFLSAGNRDLVVFGVSFHLGVEPTPGFFQALLQRHGLFTITQNGRMVPTKLGAVDRWLRVEKARSGGLFWNVGRLGKSWLEWLSGRARPQVHDAAEYQKDWREFMGDNWKPHMDDEIEVFRKTILLVRSYGADVKVILLPQGTWMDDLPFKPYYEAKIRALCNETSTQLIDLSRSIPDAEFQESNHLTVEGQQDFRKIIMGIVDKKLQAIGSANAHLDSEKPAR